MNFHIKALSVASTVVIWFIALITILMEIYEEPIKPFLTSITGHHWVTKGMFAVVLFAVVYGVCARMTSDDTEADPKYIYVAISSAVLAGLTIFGYFVWHFLAS